LAKHLQTSFVVCAHLFTFIATSLNAEEYPPIGRHYAGTISIFPPGSEMNLRMSKGHEIADINGDGLGDVIYNASPDGAHHDPDLAALPFFPPLISPLRSMAVILPQLI
jgi:hypothetical protein